MLRMIARLTFAMLAGTAIVASGSANASTYSVVYSFTGPTSDGAAPLAGLLSVPSAGVGANLYGTTSFGGSGSCSLIIPGCGTVFGIDTGTSTESVVYSFSGTDGYQPTAAVINVGGSLYGTAGFGGSGCGGTGCGVLFKLNPSTGVQTVLHNFTTGGDAHNPFASVVNVSGKLYGTTQYGGTFNSGAIYSYDTSTSTYAVEYSFGGTSSGDGTNPISGLTKSGTVLYGTTLQGGTSSDGTIIKFDTSTGTESVLYSFAGGSGDGAHPYAGVIVVGNFLYGVTRSGGGTGCGGNGCGVVFRYNLTTGVESIVHDFNGADGSEPLASLLNVSGTLYGTTISGGISASGTAYGTIFSVDPVTGSENVLHTFGIGSDGRSPRTTLINVGGTLYGTTSCGGSGGTSTSCSGDPGYGTVFAYTP